MSGYRIKLKNRRVTVVRDVIDGEPVWGFRFKSLLNKGHEPRQATRVRGRVMTVGFTLSNEAMAAMLDIVSKISKEMPAQGGEKEGDNG